MSSIILGEHPESLTVRLVHGDGAALVATLTDAAGAPTNWPATPTLEFGDQLGAIVGTYVATVAGSAATWTLTRANVDTIYAASLNRYGSPITRARATLPDGDDGSVEYAGVVQWSDGWSAGSQSQSVTFTLPGGATGPAGASAYQIAVANGFVGTEAAWLASLGGSGGAVDSVNGDVGIVVLSAVDVGAEAAGSVATHAGDTTAVHGIADTSALVLTGDARLTDARVPLTHLHTSAQVTDFVEAAQDAVAAMLGAGTNVTLTYDDAANTLSVSATASGGTGLDAEAVRDAIGIALVGVGNVAVAVNDAADTITISTTATVNSTDAALRDRATHTGTQSLDTTTDSATRLAFLAAERTKLTGVATGATANSTDAALRARASHTGTQTSASISDFTEAVQDAVAATLVGSGVTVTYDDTAGTVTLAAAESTDLEAVRDAIGVALVGVGNIAVTVDDAANTITITTTATVNSTDAALRDRGTHTGTQAASTVTGLATVATSGLKADVGLGNVDNTTDANKPVSTAQATADALKLAKASNLSDLASAPTARTNLGLGSAAVATIGVASGEVPVLGAGGRLSIARVASGIPDGTKFVRDDGTLAAPAGGGGSSGLPFGFVVTADPANANTTASIGLANRTIYQRVVSGATITKVAIDVTTSAGNIAISVHSNTGSGRTSAPGTRLATTGAVACPAVGYAEISLGASVVVAAGDWIGIGGDNATTAFRGFGNALLASDLFAGRSGYASDYPAPNPPSAITNGLGRAPLVIGVP